MKTPQEEVNELVEMFANELSECNGTSSGAINISILHVERLIDVLEKINIYWWVPASGIKELDHYQQVLQILKDKK